MTQEIAGCIITLLYHDINYFLIRKIEMNMTDKKYSVLMSVYNKELPENLNLSIASVMNQTVQPNEFVIVCDGLLTEELDNVLNRYIEQYPGMFIIEQLLENKGLGVALNIGLKKCSNDIVARMDSDDICMPDRMERQLEAMEREQADIVSGTVLEFTDNKDHVVGRRVLPEKKEDIRKFARRRNPFNHPAVMYRKHCVIDAGGYKDFRMFEDYYLWIRMLLLGYEGYNIQEPVLYMRAGDALYRRRGGLHYARQVLVFRGFMFRKGYSGLVDFLVTAGGHMMVALAPNGMRKRFYERMLRE